MAYQPINLGSAPDDGTGDPPRTAGTKINSNFTELYSAVVNINAETAVIDGTGDQIQLRVQGHSTQTSDIFVIENSAGTDLLTVDNSGNVTVTGTVDGRDLATDGTKLDGIEAGADVTDQANVTAALAGGTVAGAVTIDGSSDAIQLRVQGNSAQTSQIFVVENSAGADLFRVENSGDILATGKLTLNTLGSVIQAGTRDITFDVGASTADTGSIGCSGNLFIDPTTGNNTYLNFYTGASVIIGNGAGAISGTKFYANGSADFGGKAFINGSADAVQLTVQGNAVQTSYIFVVENSAGTNLVTVDNSGNIDVAGTGTFGGSSASGNALYLQSGDAGATIPPDSTQIRFGYSNTNSYAHSLRTRHSASTTANNAIDFYLWDQSTDAAGDLGTHRALTIDLASSTLFGGLLIDGHSDSAQLTVQGNATQTSDIFVIENSAGTDLLTVDNSGRLSISDGMDHGLVWKDLLGFPVARTLGATDPNFTAFRGVIDAYAFGVGEEVMFYFHIPHDYASASTPGSGGTNTDIYLHVHWGHNGTAISGNMQWDYAATYAKGHDQAAFPAEVTGSITFNTTNITTTPQYQHRIDEIQLSSSSPSASQIDSDDLEVDGLLMVRISAGAIPTITGGSPNEPFLFMVDIHYQASTVGTLNKAPNFYT